MIIKVDNIRKCFSFLLLCNCHQQCFAKKQLPQMLPYEILIEILAIVTIDVIIDLAQAKYQTKKPQRAHNNENSSWK